MVQVNDWSNTELSKEITTSFGILDLSVRAEVAESRGEVLTKDFALELMKTEGESKEIKERCKILLLPGEFAEIVQIINEFAKVHLR